MRRVETRCAKVRIASRTTAKKLGRRCAILFAASCLFISCRDDKTIPDLEWSLGETDFWPDLRDYPGVGQGRLLITNNLSDSVSILDLGSVASDGLAEMARVPVGLIPVEREGPHHLTADPTGEYYYVGISNYVPGSGSGPHGVHGVGTSDGHALKIRASDNVTIASVRVDRNPGDIRLTPDGRLLLMSHFDLLRISEAFQKGSDPSEMDARLAIIDPQTMTRQAMVNLCPAPHGLTVSPDSRTAYVSCISDEIAIVDLASQEHFVRRVPVIPSPGSATSPICYPYALTISPAGDSVWVSCFKSGEVLRYDVASQAMDTTRRVSLFGSALFGTFTSDGKTLLIPHQGTDGIAFIDAAAGSLTSDLPLPRNVCFNAHIVKLTPDEARALVVCEGNHTDPGTFVVINIGTRTVERFVAVGKYPDDLAILRRAP